MGRLGEGGGSSQVDPSTGMVVATCFWHGCDSPAPVVDTVALVPPGSQVALNCRVPLCLLHRQEWRRTGRLRLFTHPENLVGR